MSEVRTVVVTPEHLKRAIAYFDKHPTAYPTDACLMNQALRDAFPEKNPNPPDESDERFNCDETEWRSADGTWALDETGVHLIWAFDNTDQDRPASRKPFPSGLLPTIVWLTKVNR